MKADDKQLLLEENSIAVKLSALTGALQREIALLELESMTVDLVTSGGAAIDYLSRSRPDVVLLDVGLPDMDGTKVYARIAEMHPTLPVVFSTGHADRARLDDVLTAPHVTCLLKPYDLGSLRAALDSVDS